MVPHAILLDLDETLIDRTLSMTQYAEWFQRDFADALSPLLAPTLAATIVTADERDYRPREALYADLLQQLAWQQRPAIGRLRTHWETWFPASSVARVGLHETLATLHAQGIRLGVITNGAVGRQQPKIETLQIQPYLSTVVISEAVQVKKPDPRILPWPSPRSAVRRPRRGLWAIIRSMMCWVPLRLGAGPSGCVVSTPGPQPIRCLPGKSGHCPNWWPSCSRSATPQPNLGVQATANSVRSCVAPALRRA